MQNERMALCVKVIYCVWQGDVVCVARLSAVEDECVVGVMWYVAGVGMGSYVEAVARKLGFKEPALTEEQQELSSCKVASNMGAALGVALGCFLGMFPLLLVEHQVKKRPEQGEHPAPRAPRAARVTP
jgi:hypothetical protein